LKKFLCAAFALSICIVLWLAPAADAVAAPPVVTDLNSSTPGHVTGTITSPGAPFIRIRLYQNTLVWPVELTLSGDAGTFDLPTWGYSGATHVYTTACTTSDLTTCSDEVASAATFVPVDVAPQVTWSADTFIGQGESPSVTVEDSGGGVLTASMYSTYDGILTNTPNTTVDQHGTTAFAFPDGSTDIHLLRCDAANPNKCTELSPSQIHHYEIHRTLAVSWVPLTAISTTRPTTTLRIDTDRAGSYDIDWHLEVAGQPLAEPSGSLVGQPLDGNGALAPIVIDGTALTDETVSYVVVAQLAVHDPVYGTYSREVTTGFVQPRPTFVVDRTRPAVTSFVFRPPLSNAVITTIYPNVNMSDRPGMARVWTDSADYVGIAVKNATGTRVRAMPGNDNVIWNGKNASGVVVPSGTYYVVAYDVAGNESAAVGHLKVDARHRVVRTWTRTVKAAPSLVEKYVGRCSTLRRPSARGWAGSLGFYANTRCSRQTWNASAVSTMHGIYLPSVDRYLGISVDLYGGAAKARPHSYAGIRLYNAKGQWLSWHGLEPYLGRHHGLSSSGPYTPVLVYPDRAFYWGMATDAGGRYDVARFIVTVRYYALV